MAARNPQGGQTPSRVRGGSDLAPRIVVAIPAIIFALVIVDQGGEIWAIGIFLLGVVAMGELYTLMGRVRPPALAGFLTMAAMLVAALYGEPRHVIMVLAASFPVTFVLAVLRPRRENVSWAIAVTYLGVLWIGLALVFAVWLRELPHGDGLVIDVLVATFLGDTFAYFGGRWYGRTPLAPLISPNKTLEGLVAGVWGPSLSNAVTEPVGDLFESMIKRDLEVKDTGKLFGAHGGVLDRLDAVMFTIPVAYYAAVGLGYAS